MRSVLLFLGALGFAVAAAAATPEGRLSAVFDAIEANRVDEAMRRVDALLRDYPNFRLAYLVRGDLLLARAQPLQTFGNVVKTVPQERIEGLREEALAPAGDALAADRRPAAALRAAASSRAEARPGGRLAPLAALRVWQRPGPAAAGGGLLRHAW